MKILIAGDFCPRDRVAQLFERDDYRSVLDDVKGVLGTVDYSVVNFECPIVTGDAKPIIKHGPNLKCSPKGMGAIKWAGFNCVTLANNHFYDYGNDGVANTIETCKVMNIDYVGGGHNAEEASKTMYKQIGNQTLAIINCCEHEYSIATEYKGGSNPLNTIQQHYAIQEAKTKADYIVVIVHGGHELFQLPSPRMVEAYRFFIDSGADAVVNHHQHCFSGYEIYKGKPIFYGLGNFCFDNPYYREGVWTEGYMLVIEFDSPQPKFVIHPYVQCAKNASVKLVPNDTFDIQLRELNNTISDKKMLQSSIDKYYDVCSNQYNNIFEPIWNRYYIALKQKGWLPSLIGKKRKIVAANYVICEAHRDKLISWLEK